MTPGEKKVILKTLSVMARVVKRGERYDFSLTYQPSIDGLPRNVVVMEWPVAARKILKTRLRKPKSKRRVPVPSR